jgi:hypothetical protein
MQGRNQPPISEDLCLDAQGPIFDFETDFAGTLRCIPMCVRFKLDECGIKLSLKQWNRIPSADRRQLVTRPCDTPDRIPSYREFLVKIIESHTSKRVDFVSADKADWADGGQIPPRIFNHAMGLGVAPPSLEQWSSLSPLQRFALYKLTRPNHSNDNFIPAMREFGLME